MARKVFKTIILFVIFGVPIFWYLFLQFFGENKFELPQLAPLPSGGVAVPYSLRVLRNPITIDEQNQYQRLAEYAEFKSFQFLFDVDSCLSSHYSEQVILIDKSEHIRGIYGYSIQEIDRAIVELDLLIKLENE